MYEVTAMDRIMWQNSCSEPSCTLYMSMTTAMALGRMTLRNSYTESSANSNYSHALPNMPRANAVGMIAW